MSVTELVKWINELIAAGKLYKFYKSKEWKQLKVEILKENNNECRWCKEKGTITKAKTVHHVQYVKKHPHLALSRTYIYNGKEYVNLIPLCHDCHDKAHCRMGYKAKPKPVTEERWE